MTKGKTGVGVRFTFYRDDSQDDGVAHFDSETGRICLDDGNWLYPVEVDLVHEIARSISRSSRYSHRGAPRKDEEGGE